MILFCLSQFSISQGSNMDLMSRSFSHLSSFSTGLSPAMSQSLSHQLDLLGTEPESFRWGDETNPPLTLKKVRKLNRSSFCGYGMWGYLVKGQIFCSQKRLRSDWKLGFTVKNGEKVTVMKVYLLMRKVRKADENRFSAVEKLGKLFANRLL